VVLFYLKMSTALGFIGSGWLECDIRVRVDMQRRTRGVCSLLLSRKTDDFGFGWVNRSDDAIHCWWWWVQLCVSVCLAVVCRWVDADRAVGLQAPRSTPTTTASARAAGTAPTQIRAARVTDGDRESAARSPSPPSPRSASGRSSDSRT